jgi:hypothetical protein
MGKKRQGKKSSWLHGLQSRDKCHKAKCGRMTKATKNQCGSEKERMKAQK